MLAIVMTENQFVCSQKYEQNISLFEDSGDRLSVRALVFYSGTHANSMGIEREFSRELISTYAANSNARLLQGESIKLFKDHYYSSDSVIGFVNGFSVGEITQETLTKQSMTNLIGELGVFADITILGSDNVERYMDKRIKEVSVGIDIGEERFYEVSVVPFPALAGASMYKKYGGREMPDKTETFNAEQFSELKAQFEAMKVEAENTRLQLQETTAKLEATNREKETTNLFHSLRSTAANLRDQGKLPPAAYGQIFADGKEKEAIATFSQEGNQQLAEIAFYLEMVSQYHAAIVESEELSTHAEIEPPVKSPAAMTTEQIEQRAAALASKTVTYGVK